MVQRKNKLNIYFAVPLTSISNDRIKIYRKISKLLEKCGDILNEKIVDIKFRDQNISNIPCQRIHDFDLGMINNADMIFAEISRPSLGVGYEIRRAIELNKPVLCVFDQSITNRKNISKIIMGSPASVYPYSSLGEILVIFSQFAKQIAQKHEQRN